MAFLSLGASLPSVEVTVDFTNAPTSGTRTWTDITPYVVRFSIRRGRENELTSTSPGTLTAELRNDDRRFDPSYASSPYSPGVLPMRRIRVRAQWNSVTYNLFHGYVESWPQTWPDGGKGAFVTVSAVDAFKVLNMFDLVGKSYGTALTSTRIGTVLFDAGIPTSDQSLQAGQSSIVASGTFAEGSPALAHIQDVAASENGVFFIDGGGTAVFQDRHYRSKSEATASGTIGDADGEIRYRDSRADYGDDKVWNIVRVTASGGTAEQTTDAASTASYYQRILVWPPGGNYLVSSQAEALSAAQYLLGRYKAPYLAIPEAEIVGGRATALWSTVLASEISDRIRTLRRPPGGGTIDQDCHIEQIAIDATAERAFAVRWSLSNASAGPVWILDTSALDTATVLGY